MTLATRIRALPVRQMLVSGGLTLGLSIGKAAGENDVRSLVRRLHPVETEHSLIRLGSDGDGGYLVPDDLDGIAACFSPGVDNRVSFESGLVDRGIRCFLADASVPGAPYEHEKVHFVPKFVDVITGEHTTTLDDWVSECAPGDDDLVLQMDIEGAEWPVLLNVSASTLRRFRVVVVEMHDLEKLFDRVAFPVLRGVFDRLLQDFHVVHNHPNNYGGRVRRHDVVVPRVLELTLLRKDRARGVRPATQFPHPLDRKNAEALPDVELPAGWYGGG